MQISVSGNPDNHGFSGGNSVSQNGWNGGNSYFQFTLDATSYQNLILTWTGNFSSTGPATNSLQSMLPPQIRGGLVG